MSESDFHLPPATFEFLVFSLKTQAEMRLGLISFGEENEEPNLPAARHAIDLLAMGAQKTRGHLFLQVQPLIENALTELRFRLGQVSDSAPKPGAPKTAQEPASETPPGSTTSDATGKAEGPPAAS